MRAFEAIDARIHTIRETFIVFITKNIGNYKNLLGINIYGSE